MKAFAVRKYGEPVVQIQAPEPAVGAGDVLVEMVAAGVNQTDERLRSGGFKQILPFDLPLILGSDIAGRVVAVGEKVSGFTAGDEVFAFPGMDRVGTFADRVAVNADSVARMPTSLSFAEAASLPVVALTAWQILAERGRIGPGHTVLIHGGAGGVGSIAIQVAKHLGATVATTASASSADFVRELGADIVIDYRDQDFEQLLGDVDLVLDNQGGQTLMKSLRVLRRGGKVFGIADPPDPAFADRIGANPVVALTIRAMSSKVRRQARRQGVSYEFYFVHPDGGQLRQIGELIDDGALRPIVDRVLPFDQTPHALQALTAGGVHGKIVVSRQ
ncbi:NADP-dependent oxidoreductase [Dietzia aerolata]|uniref:NADP-dependent oxidoreductase n=1 Tax=Dietzia aerolata TaxID=595984 RepID=A0ABV5JNU7_9ACTN|nr:NADP-dependent oxidoreductase [Dietzia aerolata]